MEPEKEKMKPMEVSISTIKTPQISTKNIVNASVISFLILLSLSIGASMYLDLSNPGKYTFTEKVKTEREMFPDKDLQRLKKDIVNLCVSIYDTNKTLASSPPDKSLDYRYDLYKNLLDSQLVLFRYDLEKRFKAFTEFYPLQSNYILPYLNSLIVPFNTLIFTALLFYIFYEIQNWFAIPNVSITYYHKIVISLAIILNLIALLAGPLVLIPMVDERMNLADISVEKCAEQRYDIENGAFDHYNVVDIVESLV